LCKHSFYSALRMMMTTMTEKKKKKRVYVSLAISQGY
jgi:hypothetical protein